MRTADKARLRAGSAKRGAALGFIIIALVLLGGSSMVYCARQVGNEQVATPTKAKPGVAKPTPKKAPPAKKKPAPAPVGTADGLFRGYSPN